jgi:uncharacterized protein (TIGR02646 family)
MIRIGKGAAPRKLQSDGAKSASRQRAEYDRDPKEYNSGRKTFEFSAAIYAHSTVKAALEKAQHGKCCYCEVAPEKPYAFLHVEHYRPKAYSQQGRNAKKCFPGYYWLAYEWSNLFLACHFCNSSNKKNFFPLVDEASRAKNHHGNINAEQPLIIRPDGPDDPRSHIGYYQEIPFGKTSVGRATVESLGLDRSEHEPRLRLFNQLRWYYSLVVKYGADASPAAKEVVAYARTQLTSAIRADAPFSAMASAFLEQHPLP